MKYLAVALLTTLVSAEAFSQVRHPRTPDYDYDYDRYEPRRDTYEPRRDTYEPRYEPRRNYDPRYEAPRYETGYSNLTCYYGDLVRNHRHVIRSFNHNQRCELALSQVQSTGRFCDGRSMFDMRGRLVKNYRHTVLCHARLNLLAK